MSDAGSHLLVLNAAEGRVQLLVACSAEALERAGAFSRSGNQACCDDYILRCAQSWHAPSQGAELLAPALRDLCARLGLSPADLRHIAVVRGPGSFTGLRLVLATAGGLARATGALQAGLDYLPLLASSAAWRLGPLAEPGRCFWTLTHARRRLVHLQGFSLLADGDRPEGAYPLRSLGDMVVCSPEAALARVLACKGRPGFGGNSVLAPLLLGSGVSRNREFFVSALQEEAGAMELAGSVQEDPPLLLGPDFDHPTPEALLRSAVGLEFTTADILPYYARPADAEENFERIALSLRLDPARARTRLEELTNGPPDL